MAEQTIQNPFEAINRDLSAIKAQLTELARVLGAAEASEKKYYTIPEAQSFNGASQFS